MSVRLIARRRLLVNLDSESQTSDAFLSQLAKG